MRNLSELNINEGGKPVRRAAPTNGDIAAFEDHFGIKLPENHVKLLRHSNGGHPELNCIRPVGGSEESEMGVNAFYYLDENEGWENLWAEMARWRPILGADFVPFAADGFGNQFILDLRTSPPSVKACLYDDNFAIIEIAPSFEAFINALRKNPDDI